MSGILWILIDGRSSGVNAVLAREALKKAASSLGFSIRVEIQNQNRTQQAFWGQPAPDDKLLVVGAVEPPLPWAGLPRRSVALVETLNDPAEQLNKASIVDDRNASIFERSESRGTFLSSLTGWLKR